jgi:cellulose synthase (UDP-forming)
LLALTEWRGGTPSKPSDFSLPSPPSDDEKYWYMGRQHRWLLLAQAVSFSLIAYSIARFATADTRLLLFLLPMSLYTVTLLISLRSSSRRKRTSLADHVTRVARYRPKIFPSVDVFLPTAGEPLEVLCNTYDNVARLEWPGRLTVYVLDDAARPEVRERAEGMGFRYRSRPDRGRLKKAGNLRYGYEQSNGDLIAIFDADFSPRPDYLHELVPYFEETDVGIVQSPQFFDTAKGMQWLQRCAGATQELFYRWIEPARDRAQAAICVGTCALYRRSALQASGGFAQIGHSEDVHTGVNLMKVGYHVRYVPIVVSKGLCPDTLTGFLNQQYRWCTGSMSLLADRHALPASAVGGADEQHLAGRRADAVVSHPAPGYEGPLADRRPARPAALQLRPRCRYRACSHRANQGVGRDRHCQRPNHAPGDHDRADGEGVRGDYPGAHLGGAGPWSRHLWA